MTAPYGTSYSSQYRSEMDELRMLDPENRWNWKLEPYLTLPRMMWTCEIQTNNVEVVYKIGVFRNPARNDAWDISPIWPTFNRYPESASIAQDVIDGEGIPVIVPSPPPSDGLGELRVRIRDWVRAALEQNVVPAGVLIPED